jgi:hypothetical protein
MGAGNDSKSMPPQKGCTPLTSWYVSQYIPTIYGSNRLKIEEEVKKAVKKMATVSWEEGLGVWGRCFVCRLGLTCVWVGQGTIVLIVVLSVVGALLLVLLLVFTFHSSWLKKGGKKAKNAATVAGQKAMYSYAYVPTASMFQYHPPARAGYAGSMHGV